MGAERRLLGRVAACRAAAGLAVGLGALGGVVSILQAGLLSRVVERVFLGGEGLAEVGVVVGVLGGLAAFRAGAGWGAARAARHVAARVQRGLREDLARHWLALGPIEQARRPPGELSQLALGGVEDVEPYVARFVPQAAQALIVPPLVLACVAATDLLSGVVLLVTYPLIPVFLALIGSLARERAARQWTRLARLGAGFLDLLRGIGTLQAFGRSRAAARRLVEAEEEYRRATLDVLRVAFVSSLSLELLTTLSIAVVAVEVGLRLLQGRLEFQPALFVLLLAPEFYKPLRELGGAFHAAVPGREAARRIWAVLDSPARMPVRPVRPVAPPARPYGVAFDAVHFSYATDRPAALAGVSFEIRAGETAVLVGPSGSGKSTLAALLLGFAAPASGTVRIAGVPLGTIDPEAWRRQVAWVPQRPYLFHGSVLDNVRIGRPDATAEQVQAALESAHAAEFVRALPGGVEARVGEDAAGLSGGQAQRIALARAFVKDAPLLVLDEPTAHLDAESEALVGDALRTLSRGRTVLLIAHRLGTAATAQRLVVLDRGRVVEQGAPEELRASGRVYPRLLAAFSGAGP